MRTYIIKRILLMIPTLFGISLVLWLVVTAAPGDPGQKAMGEAQTQRSGNTGESRRIFREQFNLDKPLFWNDYVSLTPQDVLATVRTGNDLTLPGKDRSAANRRMLDWGYYSVPGLVGALDLAGNTRERAGLLFYLQTNAKRTGATRVGRRYTEEEKAENMEIAAESRDIDTRLAIEAERFRDAEMGTPAAVAEMERLVAERAPLWKRWYAERKGRWEWSGAERLRRRLLDTQFAKYWWNLLHFDLGDSHVHREPVLALIFKRIPISLTLSVTSLILAFALSVPLGIWGAVRHRKPDEQAVSTLLFMLYSLPEFFVASMLLRYLGIGHPFKWIPVAGFESSDTFSMTTWGHVKDIAWHSVAPIWCMTYVSLAGLSRYAKSGVLNQIRSDYVRTARSKGLPEWSVIVKHTVRNGIIPIVTLLGTTLPVIVGGSIIVESVFTIPGIGHLIWDSILQRDYNVVIGEALIVAVLTMVGILVSDILYAVVDPRITYQ
ncbi:MAG TPA: ABC transporter permease [Planctomycetota bacterium]|nr:ABC transporter permease [Planctomycetota bacterium]